MVIHKIELKKKCAAFCLRFKKELFSYLRFEKMKFSINQRKDFLNVEFIMI